MTGTLDLRGVRLLARNGNPIREVHYGGRQIWPYNPHEITFPETVALTDPVLVAARVGDAIFTTEPTFNITPLTISKVLQVSDTGSGSWTTLDGVFTHVPVEAEGKYLRWLYTVMGAGDEDPVVFASNVEGPVNAAEADEDLFQLNFPDVEVTGSFYVYDSAMWFKPIITLPGVPANHRVRWTTTRPDLYPNDGPEIDWEMLEPRDGHPGQWTTMMTDEPEKNGVITPTRQDFSIFREQDPITRERLRFAHQPAASDPETDPWSPISPAAWNIPVPLVIPPTLTREYRSYQFQSPAMHGVTPNVPSLYEYGILPGDCYQWYPAVGKWSKDGDKLVTGQDAGQLLYTNSKGNFWFRCRARGLPVHMICSLLWDPADNDRFLVLAGAGLHRASKMNVGGIFETRNNGDDFSRLHVLSTPGRAQQIMDSFAVYPITGGPTSKWYVAVGLVNSSNTFIDGKLMISSDNGNTWPTERNLPYSTFGRMYQLEVIPGSPGHLLLSAEKGFFKSTNDGVSWTQWHTGLPKNVPVSSFWRDPSDPTKIYCTVRTNTSTQQGVWYSADGSSFSRIRQCNAHHLSMGAPDGSGNRTLYVMTQFESTSTDTPHIRLRNGTWITAKQAAPNNIVVNWRGAQSNIFPYNGLTFQGSVMQQTWFSAHPIDIDLCIAHTKTSFLRTEDSGKNLVLESGGASGLNWRGCFNSLEDPLKVTFSLHDAGCGLSDDGMSTARIISLGNFKKRASFALSGSETGITSFTGRGVMRFPDNTSVIKSDWRGRMVGGAGGSASTSGVLFYVNKGDTVMRDWLSTPVVQGEGRGARTTAGHLPHNPNKAWVGISQINLATQDEFVNVAGSRIILGCANDGTDTIYGLLGPGNVSRSPNFGGSWAPFYDFGTTTPNILSAGFFAGECSGYDGRIFLKYAHRAFAMLLDNNGTAVRRDFNVAPLLSTVSPLPSDATISDVAHDPLDPRYVYLGFDIMGYGLKIWEGKFNADFTSIDWTDVTLNGPENGHSVDLYTHPYCGGVQVAQSGLGSFLLPAPDDWQPRVGAFRFSGQPSSGNSLSVGGQTVTFGSQVTIGVSLAATLTNLANFLNASSNTTIARCTYKVEGNRLDVFMKNPAVGVIETFPLSASSTPNATVGNIATPWKRGIWLKQPRIGNT